MSKDFNISMICLILNWFVYDPSWMLHLSEFVRTLRSSVLVVFNNFLLIDATARSKISSDQKRFFIALSLYIPFHFSRTLPLNDKGKLDNRGKESSLDSCQATNVTKNVLDRLYSLYWVAWLDSTTDCMCSTCCTDKEHATFRLGFIELLL